MKGSLYTWGTWGGRDENEKRRGKPVKHFLKGYPGRELSASFCMREQWGLSHGGKRSSSNLRGDTQVGKAPTLRSP